MDAWLYIVLLGAVILVYAQLLPKSPGAAAPVDVVKEIETAIDHFSSEMEDENRQLLNLISGMKTEHESQVRDLLARIDELERNSRGLSAKIGELSEVRPAANEPAEHPASGESRAPDQAVQPPETRPAAGPEPEPSPREDSGIPAMTIKSRYSELFRLLKEGKSTEAIAKKLGMNKGEVMLIQQLGKQEEQSRA